MRFIAGLLLVIAGATALSVPFEEEFAPFRARSAFLEKKELLSCGETYGKDSKQCGPHDSGFCYTPKLGQSCCKTDFGFCNAGSYCAPVGGYCCMDGETLEECAEASGFKLPASLLSKTKPKHTTTKKPTKTTTKTTTGRLGPTPGDIGRLCYFPTPKPSKGGAAVTAGASLGSPIRTSGSGAAAFSNAGFGGGTGVFPTEVALPSGTSGVFGGGNSTRPPVVTKSSAPPRVVEWQNMILGVGLLITMAAVGVL